MKILPNNPGFTLIELCICLGVIAILAAIALPTFRDLIVHSREEIAAASTLRMIKLAERTAIAKQMPIIICKSKDLLHCNGSWQDREIVVASNQKTDEAETKNEEQDFQNANQQANQQIVFVDNGSTQNGYLRWRSYPRYRNFLMFMPNGLLASDNSTIWYCL